MSRVFHRFQPLRSRLCFGVEFLLIFGAVLLAAVIRFSTKGIMLSKGIPYLPQACLIALVCQVCMYYADLYNFRIGLSDRRFYIKLVRALSLATMVLMVLFYLLPPLTIGRGIMLLSLPLAFGLLVSWRLLYRQLQSMNQFRVKVLILGTGEEARQLADELAQSNPPGYEFKGFVGDDDQVGGHIL